VNAVASARTGVISAAAGTAAGVALLLVNFARLGLLDPGSVVTGALVVTPGWPAAALPDAGAQDSSAVTKTRGCLVQSRSSQLAVNMRRSG
jgi:hypothetical protein